MAKVWTVNLARRSDRRVEMQALCDKHGIVSNRFFTAVDGESLQADAALATLCANNTFQSRRGVLGCALSHMHLWLQLLHDVETNTYVVFEDDIVLAEQLTQDVLNSIATQCTDVLYLGYSINRAVRASVPEFYAHDAPWTVRDMARTDLYWGGTFAYIVTKSGARKLVDHIVLNGLRAAVDVMMVHRKPSTLILQECVPMLAMSEYAHNDMPHVQSDIQRSFARMNWDGFGMFVHLPYIQVEGDVLHVEPVPMTSLQLMFRAAKMPGCVAFALNGVFYSRITVPLQAAPGPGTFVLNHALL